jgi:uncharacterized protein (UPF0332 family)
VLNFPVREYLESGIIAQVLFKMFFQQAVERRNTDDYPTPVFLWSDEVQYFIQPSDQLFLTKQEAQELQQFFSRNQCPIIMQLWAIVPMPSQRLIV